MIIAGIDYSYTSPAICVYDTDNELTFENLWFYNMNDKKKLVGAYGNLSITNFPEWNTNEERYRNICKWASRILVGLAVKEVTIEGYSFGSSSGLVFNIAENASLIKQYMDMNGIKFHTPTPSQVKKNFTGKGNAKKEAMVEEFYKRYPEGNFHKMLNIKEGIKDMKPIDDIVDSFAVLLCHDYFKDEK